MLQFYVAVLMAKLTVLLSVKDIQQAIKQYYTFSLYIKQIIKLQNHSDNERNYNYPMWGHSGLERLEAELSLLILVYLKTSIVLSCLIISSVMSPQMNSTAVIYCGCMQYYHVIYTIQKDCPELFWPGKNLPGSRDSCCFCGTTQ